jgi:16S rRNA (guanine527-N7)-methyltransferase
MDFKKEMNLTDEQEQKFYEYMKLLKEWNEKINLTTITEEQDILLKHFVDSLTILKYLNDNDNIIDVGTGAGFPGIPVKIVNETLNVTLMDSLNKRILFLNDVIEKLKLEGIKTVHARAEELGRNKEYREKYDVVTSRAVANLSTLLEYMMPFAKVGGTCICMKGPNIEEELENADLAIKELGGKLEKIENFKLPGSDIERNIIIIKKVRNISNKYPRKAGTPAKEPLINN